MIFPIVKKFNFHRLGNANRRDADAVPKNLLCGMNYDNHEVLFHVAGDEYIRTRCVFDAMLDHEFMEAFGTMEGCQIALEYARARDMQTAAELAQSDDAL